jgi:hypothetical protein
MLSIADLLSFAIGQLPSAVLLTQMTIRRNVSQV